MFLKIKVKYAEAMVVLVLVMLITGNDNLYVTLLSLPKQWLSDLENKNYFSKTNVKCEIDGTIQMTFKKWFVSHHWLPFIPLLEWSLTWHATRGSSLPHKGKTLVFLTTAFSPTWLKYSFLFASEVLWEKLLQHVKM